ncbi:phosphotransferase family protein [Allokutzneria oryzae]|uniref:Phosphotransferase family protein n=1 Tax=Allokutzneria oryzae TaxID=1378989 RepID=A0ABV6A370_9PSEU
MDFRPVVRTSQAFQRSVTAEEISSICRRVLGADATAATELGTGMYNNTYRVTVAGQDRPVILRVAPEPALQFRSEHQLMRNEYASVPWLGVIAPLMPRVIAADWSHELIGRDYMVQTLLDGVPAPERLSDYPRSAWPVFFRQLGEIARTVHAVRGPGFGPVSGPHHATWSQAILTAFDDIAKDAEGVGLDVADIREVAAVVTERAEVLDEVTEPRMLTGDLWTVNVMLSASAPEPTITGVLDMDRTWWGDPAADWTIRMAAAKPGTERDAFWESYGSPENAEHVVWRSWVYEARHLAAIRLERHRLGNADGVRNSYTELAAVLAHL